jgi:hypothetical protein
MPVASKTVYPITSGATALQIDGGASFSGTLTQTNVDLGGGVRAIRLTGPVGGFITAATAAHTLAVGTDLWALFRLHVEAFPAGGGVMDLLAWRHNTNTYDSFAAAISSGTWRARYAGTTRTTSGLATADEQTITVLVRLRQNSGGPTNEKEITVFISGQTTNWTFTFANSELYEYETLAIGSDTDRATLDIIAAAVGTGTPDGSSNALSNSAAQALADDFTVLWGSVETIEPADATSATSATQATVSAGDTVEPADATSATSASQSALTADAMSIEPADASSSTSASQSSLSDLPGFAFSSVDDEHVLVHFQGGSTPGAPAAVLGVLSNLTTLVVRVRRMDTGAQVWSSSAHTTDANGLLGNIMDAVFVPGVLYEISYYHGDLDDEACAVGSLLMRAE